VGIAQGKPAKLARAERPAAVAAHDAAHHHQDPGIISRIDHQPKGFNEGACLGPCRQTKSNGTTDLGRGRNDVALRRGGANEVERRLAGHHRVVPVPLLPLLAQVNRVQEIWRWSLHRLAPNRPEIRDGQRLNRWFGKEQVAQWRPGRLGKGFQLLDGRRLLTRKPQMQARELRGKIVVGPA
jgi:hypothetical protein